MDPIDIAVIGGGPAGAHAAAKAALLFRTCVLFDKGRKFSRIFWSPHVNNIPGRHGVSGRELVANGYTFLQEIAADLDRDFVTVHENTAVTAVRRDAATGLYHITATGKAGETTAVARNIILATGCVDGQPQLRDFRKRDIEAVLPYANKGLADYCLLCDGHTVQNKRVAVLGCGAGAASIAASLKANFGADTVVVAACNLGHPDAAKHGGGDADWAAIEARLASKDIPVVQGAIEGFTGIRDGQFGIQFTDGREERFDKAWISMGWYRVNNDQAKQLGAALDADGFVITDKDGRLQNSEGAVIPGAYAIGDLRADSWKQVPIAWGEAEAAVVDCFVTA